MKAKMAKQLLCGTMSLAMLFSLSAPAKAATAGSPQETPVEVAAEAATFNVTIPTQIALEQKADATVICPSKDAVKIVNHSPAPIKVTEISVKNGAWTLADYNGGSRSKLAKEKVNAKKLGLQLTANGNAAATSTDGNQQLSIDSSKWTIAGTGTDSSELPIAVSAIATAVSSSISAAQTAASVIFTVAWDNGAAGGGGADIPNENVPVMFSYKDGHHWSELVQMSIDQITKITFQDTYVPSGTEDAVWDDTDVNGEEIPKFYRTGTEVIIAGNGSGKIMAAPNSAGMFYQFRALETIENLELLDTSNVRNMKYMFRECIELTNLDVSHFDTSKVIDMNGMFGECRRLTSLDISNFDTSKVTNMSRMFRNCAALTTIYVGDKWSTDKLIPNNTEDIFFACEKLPGFSSSNVGITAATTTDKGGYMTYKAA